MKALLLGTAAVGLVLGMVAALVATPVLGGDWARGDMNCSGQVDPVDSLVILRYDAGLSTDLPPGCPPIGPTPTPLVTPSPSPTPQPIVLPPPQDLGSISAGGKAQVTISNDAPHALSFSFDGPEPQEFDMGACATCIEWAFPPIFCPEKGPQKVLLLAPGSYTVRVETDDPNIRPFQGVWELEGNHEYFECFYILKSFGWAADTLSTP